MGIDEIIKSVLHRSYHGGSGQMKLISRQDKQSPGYAISGSCPHCSVISLCNPVGSSHRFNDAYESGECVITQCQNCNRFVLLVVKETAPSSFKYYPLGRADASVDLAVPEKIAADFSEALRCLHAGAYRATVTMCRRAIQASAKDLNASGKWLIEQIDDLADKGKITEPLKDMAHHIRKIGNDGAHPDDDLLKDVDEQDAADIVKFVREYFNHIYVIPQTLKSMIERKAKPK